MVNAEYAGGGEGAKANNLQRARSSSLVPPDSPSTQNQMPLPHYFIVRPGSTKITASGTVTTPGPIVPLIAVDQLPEWLELSGVPRELSVEQTVGLRNLGTVPRHPGFYNVYMSDNLQDTPDPRKNDHRVQKEQGPSNLTTTAANVSPPPTATLPSPTPAEETSTRSLRIDPVVSEFHSPTSVGKPPPLYPILHAPEPGYSPIPPSYHAPLPPSHFLPSWYPPSSSSRKPTTAATTTTTTPAAALSRSGTTSSRSRSHTSGSPSSAYCKHWCHRGTCRWGAQCRYAHSMPATAAGLRDVGLAHHPAWYTTAVSMAFGPGGFINAGPGHRNPSNPNTGTNTAGVGNNGAGWYMPRHHDQRGGERNKGEKEREKRDKAQAKDKGKSMGSGVGAGKEKEKEKEKGKELDGKSKADKALMETEAEQSKGDATEEEANGASDEEQSRPEEVEKLVEI
ncbi:hypothetical protein F4811DRAFT_572170 [Daldinia bambusicola]|nr:hypothetical protein F4811DRAFT_572170 [Daldinia bambusicola]